MSWRGPAGGRSFVAALAISAVLGSVAGFAPASAGSLPKPRPCNGCYEPALDTSWQWQLRWKVDTSFDVQMYDVDAFDVSAHLVAKLHAAGRNVICYIDAGTWEQWRPDASRFPQSVLGAPNGWPGERWLDIRRLRILAPILEHRMNICRKKGFDGVEFDNVDGYQNHTGFPLASKDQLRFDVLLANQAHRRGLSVALKNDLGQVRQLLPYFDFALNEQCFQYRECWKLKPFVAAGKAVFGVEYKLKRPRFCPKANALDLNFLKKKLSLGPWRRSCR